MWRHRLTLRRGSRLVRKRKEGRSRREARVTAGECELTKPFPKGRAANSPSTSASRREECARSWESRLRHSPGHKSAGQLVSLHPPHLPFQGALRTQEQGCTRWTDDRRRTHGRKRRPKPAGVAVGPLPPPGVQPATARQRSSAEIETLTSVCEESQEPGRL